MLVTTGHRKAYRPLILAVLSDKTSPQQQNYRIEKRRPKRLIARCNQALLRGYGFLKTPQLLQQKLEKSPVWDKISSPAFILKKERKMANKEQGKDRDKDKKKKKKDKAKAQAK